MLLVVSTTAIFAQTANQEKQKKEHKTKTTYRCPMHPEVTSNKPGKCPKCGTQLVINRTGSKQAETVTYTCPTHPDVTSDKAGTCPKCGMALVQKKGEKE